MARSTRRGRHQDRRNRLLRSAVRGPKKCRKNQRSAVRCAHNRFTALQSAVTALSKQEVPCDLRNDPKGLAPATALRHFFLPILSETKKQAGGGGKAVAIGREFVFALGSAVHVAAPLSGGRVG
jgi:hypothetical protein